MNKTRNYSPEIRLEAAQLVVDQGYTLKAAAESMGVSKGSMEELDSAAQEGAPWRDTEGWSADAGAASYPGTGEVDTAH